MDGFDILPWAVFAVMGGAAALGVVAAITGILRGKEIEDGSDDE